MSIDYFAYNIKSYRRSQKLTQADFGKLIGISPQAVSKWETMMGYPDISMLPVVARLLGITIDELLTQQKEFSQAFSQA